MIRGRLEAFLVVLVRRRGVRFVEDAVSEAERRSTPPASFNEDRIKGWAERLRG